MRWTEWFVLSFLGILVIGGLLRLVLCFVRRTDLLSGADRTLDERRLIALGIMNIACATFGFALLLTKAYPALNVFMGVSIVSLLCEVAFRKGSIDWSGK